MYNSWWVYFVTGSSYVLQQPSTSKLDETKADIAKKSSHSYSSRWLYSMVCYWRKTNNEAFKEMHLKNNRHLYWLKCHTTFSLLIMPINLFDYQPYFPCISTVNMSKILRKFTLGLWKIGFKKQDFNNLTMFPVINILENTNKRKTKVLFMVFLKIQVSWK